MGRSVSIIRSEARAPIPDDSELPEAKPPIQDYCFPEHILNRERRDRGLDAARLERRL